MRVIDRDLIRGGHYGQRSCEPRKQAEHMGAPTKSASVKKVLANSEPSTHEGQSGHAVDASACRIVALNDGYCGALECRLSG
jgi:hypothetical protein